jgi:hypothetical protein
VVLKKNPSTESLGSSGRWSLKSSGSCGNGKKENLRYQKTITIEREEEGNVLEDIEYTKI